MIYFGNSLWLFGLFNQRVMVNHLLAAHYRFGTTPSNATWSAPAFPTAGHAAYSWSALGRHGSPS